MAETEQLPDEYPVMRHSMNLETVKAHEGTCDVHALILGSIFANRNTGFFRLKTELGLHFRKKVRKFV